MAKEKKSNGGGGKQAEPSATGAPEQAPMPDEMHRASPEEGAETAAEEARLNRELEDTAEVLSAVATASETADAASAVVDIVKKLDRREIDDLVQVIRDSADRLVEDQTTRGDLKLLSRTLRELRYAFKVFTPYRSRKKVTVFGSARTPPHEPAYEQAVAFGKAIAAHSWLVVTGAASGIMEAGHLGAGRENSMGLNIMLPFEQSANPIIAGDPKLVHMKYFFTRKLMFVKECDAVVCLPGGFGTLDEALEVLTLLQTGKRDMAPVVLLDAPGGSYWTDFDAYIRKQVLGGGMISPEDFSLYKLTDSVDEAVEEILGFYRNYHNMRYVRNKLVLRLTKAPGGALLDEINEKFADILVDGKFTVSEPLPEEKDEPSLAALPRLVFRFNRRSLGRLRQLIDKLNGKDEDGRMKNE